MAVIKQGILGGFSGKIGGIVGSSWKGIAVMKTKPLSVANPRTAGQVLQRAKFSAIVEDSKVILTEILKPLWDRFAQQRSGYNQFVSSNIGVYTADGMTVPEDVKMSEGSLVGAENFVFTFDTGTQEFTFDWDDNAGTGNALASDKVFTVTRNDNTGDLDGEAEVAIRTEVQNKKTSKKTVAPGDVLSGWLCFLRADGSLVSTSNYQTVTAS